jgi:four helix bundle protein
MNQFFPHEKLDVYAKALSFAALAMPAVDSWPASVSVRDQLDRAIESLVTDLVKAAHLQRTNQGVYFLECSLGSVLECAACFDVATLRNLVDEVQLQAAKRSLQTVARMEVGLRNSWITAMSVKEDAEPYAVDTQHFFSHESLAVYQRSLQIHAALKDMLCAGRSNGHRYARKIDALSTSLTLNIAEGNGRYSKLDHGKFVDIAADAGARLAACLDLAATAGLENVGQARPLLREVMGMLAGMRGYLKGDG